MGKHEAILRFGKNLRKEQPWLGKRKTNVEISLRCCDARRMNIYLRKLACQLAFFASVNKKLHDIGLNCLYVEQYSWPSKEPGKG